MSKRLAGKVAIVTGGGSYDGELGTGQATAICLAREGAQVLVADLSPNNAARTIAAIKDDSGGEAFAFIGDATNSDDSQAMIAAAVEHYGSLHVLVNNLGFGGRSSRWAGEPGLTGVDDPYWEAAFNLNLKSAMLASKYAIPAMTAVGGGSIINISSCDGIAGAMHYGVPYSVSKGALHMLTKTTAAFHGRQGIRANCIAPGHLYAAFTEDISPEIRERRRRVAPLGTEGTAWDIAWAAVFLASDQARWISGVILPVDGGLYAIQPLLGHDLIEGRSPFEQNPT
jgi:NAD(P)-dependent dehydrogenase (short-subunit alcohol dehydrogenase family)